MVARSLLMTNGPAQLFCLALHESCLAMYIMKTFISGSLCLQTACMAIATMPPACSKLIEKNTEFIYFLLGDLDLDQDHSHYP